MGLCGVSVAGHRMATSPRQGPVSLPPDGQTGGRLHIHGIKEMPAGYDAEVAELFRDLRSASGLSEADLAAQLATRPEVVQALEQGALYALPPWPETYRVVATYGTLLNLDVRPGAPPHLRPGRRGGGRSPPKGGPRRAVQGAPGACDA